MLCTRMIPDSSSIATNPREDRMARFTWDHVHLRSPDPEATAAFYERMFGAEVIRTVQQGAPRIDLKLGGADAAGQYRN